MIPRRFETGTVLRLDLESTTGAVRGLPVRVAHVRSEALGHWFHGCVFPNPLTDTDSGTFCGQPDNDQMAK